MGPCPINPASDAILTDSLFCPFMDSFYSNLWLYPDTKLPALGGRTTSVTISGFSGGSFTATNMHTIFSSSIKGVGLIAGGPYTIYNAADGISKANEMNSQGKINPLTNLNGQPVYIMSG